MKYEQDFRRRLLDDGFLPTVDLNKFYGLCTLDDAYYWWIDGRNRNMVYFGQFCDKLTVQGWRIQ